MYKKWQNPKISPPLSVSTHINANPNIYAPQPPTPLTSPYDQTVTSTSYRPYSHVDHVQDFFLLQLHVEMCGPPCGGPADAINELALTNIICVWQKIQISKLISK